MSSPDNKKTEDSYLDQSLRPLTWEEYIGQKPIKDNLKILLQAAKQRGHAAEHILFYGPPGLGKTTLANLIALETGRQIRITSGPAIERVGDLASILTNLSPNDILFIDEIHRLSKQVEEVLYPALERGVLDIIIGKGPSARTIQLDLPPFTLVGATTKIAMLSSPLRSRFSGGVFRLEYYNEPELAQIIKRSAEILGSDIHDEATTEIAKRSRFTPRTANYLLKRCRDYALVHSKKLDKQTVRDALSILMVDDIGLMEIDRKYLNVIIDKFKGGPVGLGTISAAIGEDPSTVEDVIEPYLIQEGMIERTPRGRTVTKKGFEHLGFDFIEK
ncbi:Holliday junction branch migration DNA helicase RuvB [Candidatus Nomurabacteria bacterium]|nr:Holliday junction branch migration DNA helicase RuvB [Candidatus Nomurabacteria bacterium]MCB9820459.1 Holliday junction branch migration DNA helicase RuvB [Candidatus Nomurabacteria bacterium]